MNIIGQDKLISKIDSYNNITDFPNPILLCGKEGSGKHTICNYISSKFNIELCDISSLLTHENIIDLYTHSTSQLLIIDINKVGSSRQLIPIQNSILKFIEEPPSNKLVVILVEDSGKLLNTIVNRCQIWKLQEYTIDQLKLFCEKSIDENKFTNKIYPETFVELVDASERLNSPILFYEVVPNEKCFFIIIKDNDLWKIDLYEIK